MTLRKALVLIPAGAAVAAAAVVPAVTSAHVQKHRVRVRAIAASGNVTCSGTQSTNVPYDLTVPAGKTCTVKAVTVGHNIYVDKGSTLIDQGAMVANDINATQSAKGIGIGGSGSAPGSVGHDIDVGYLNILGLGAGGGVTGAGPGTVHAGDNYICDTRIGHDVSVYGSASAAGPWIVGDRDEECSGGANLVGHNFYAEFNGNRVDVSDNMESVPPYVAGISVSLYVENNAVTTTSPVVESNFIGDDAHCQSGTKKDGDGTKNIVGGDNFGCP